VNKHQIGEEKEKKEGRKEKKSYKIKQNKIK